MNLDEFSEDTPFVLDETPVLPPQDAQAQTLKERFYAAGLSELTKERIDGRILLPF